MGVPDDAADADFDYTKYVYEGELEMVANVFETVFNEGY